MERLGKSLVINKKPEKNYKIREDLVLEWEGRKLYRIEAVEGSIISGVKAGTIGGYIEKEENLQGNAWVGDNAKVYDDAVVTGNAKVLDNAQVYEDAYVGHYTQVYDKARVCGNSKIFYTAKVYGNSLVKGNSSVSDSSIVFGDSIIKGEARIKDHCIVDSEILDRGYHSNKYFSLIGEVYDVDTSADIVSIVKERKIKKYMEILKVVKFDTKEELYVAKDFARASHHEIEERAVRGLVVQLGWDKDGRK